MQHKDRITTSKLGTFVLDPINNSNVIWDDPLTYRRINEDLLCPLDLNSGFLRCELEVPWEDRPNKPLLNALMSQGSNIEQAVSGAKIVSRRGCLTKIADGKSLNILCEKKGGIIFMEIEGANCGYNYKDLDNRNYQYSYWGKRFEQMLTASPQEASMDLKQFLESIENVRILTLTILTNSEGRVPIKFLCAGEVDAFDSNDNVFEVKCTTESKNCNTMNRWWLQSALLGVENFLIGCRNKNGIITKCIKRRLEELPIEGDKLSSNLNYLHEFLNYVLRSVRDGDSCQIAWRGSAPSSSIKEAPIFCVLSREFCNHFDL